MDDNNQSKDSTSEKLPYGRNTGRDWLIYSGHNSDEVKNEHISLHEYAHNELDGITTIGFLFISLATITHFLKDERSKTYQNLFIRLREQSEYVHEVYATWYSTSRFKSNYDDETVQEFLKNSPDYAIYYRIGNALVDKIPSLYLQSLCVVTAARVCFESAALCDALKKDLTKFSMGDVRSSEFPDKRFMQICENYDSETFIKLFQDYIHRHPKTAASKFIIGELEGVQMDLVEFLTDEFVKMNEDITDFMHKQFVDFFEQKGSKSYTNREAANFHKEMLAIVNNYCPENALVIHPDPYNVERNMIIHFEGETIQFNNEKKLCKVFFTDSITHEEYLEYRAYIEEIREITFYARHAKGLTDQFEIMDQAAQERLNVSTDVIFYLEYTGENNQIFLVIMEGIDGLQNISYLIPDDSKVLGCLFISSFVSQEWLDFYQEFFSANNLTFYIFNDISILYYLETYISNLEQVKYCKSSIVINGKSFTILLIEFIDENNNLTKMISMMGDAFYSVLDLYIKKKFKDFIHDLQIVNQYKQDIDKLIGDITTMENSHYYNTKSINYFENKN